VPQKKATVDLSYLFLAKGRENYIEVVQNLGINDICECVYKPPATHPTRLRVGSGHPGEIECKICGFLVYPLSYMYECDECTEPFLSNQFSLELNEPALCSDCS
jgi:hypothetical protein